MSTFQVPAMLKGVSTLTDGGVSLRFATQEISKEEMAMLMGKSQTFGWLLFSEQAIREDELKLEEIRKDLKGKTPSQRLKAVLFVLYTESKADGSFEQYYERRMNEIIEQIKLRLPEA